MGFPYIVSFLLISLLASPLNVSAQRYGGGHNHPSAPPPPPPPAPLPTSSTVADTDTTTLSPASTTVASVATSETPASVTEATSTSIAASTTTSTPSTPSSTGGSTCTGSGMEIQWSGDSVDYSWSGGSGSTTGCTSLGSDFQGQVAVGGSGGTIFEGNPSGYFDVSYILGYSVPMLCSSGGAKTGCSIDLLGNGGAAGTVHKNPTGPGGDHDSGSYNNCASCTPWCWACSAPDSFFAPCAGSAYTFPYDDGATVGPASGTINCCIGTSCGSTGREGSTSGGHAEPDRDPPCELCASSSKRSIDELEQVFERFEAEAPAPAHSVSLLPRRRKAHPYHGVAHGVKVLG